MHFDQNIIFIIVAAIFGISRLVARIAENSREQSQRRDQQQARPAQRTSSTPTVARARKSDEERVREFLEALGAPAGTLPPPKVQPRTNVPPRPVAPITPPPMSRPFSPDLFKPLAEKARKVFTPRATPPAAEAAAPAGADQPGAWLRDQEQTEMAAAKFDAATSVMAEKATTAPQAADSLWRNALRSRDSIRAAFILREILGPPRGLSEPELA